MGNCEHLVKPVKFEKSKLCEERLLFKRVTVQGEEKTMHSGQGLCIMENSEYTICTCLKNWALSFAFIEGSQQK